MTQRLYKQKKDFYCYNCGAKNSHFSRKCPMDQQYTRCPACKAVAFSEAGHKISCQSTKFVSTKIGVDELPFKKFQDIRFVFRNLKSIGLAQETTEGTKYFLMTKFLSLGTNIKFRRVYGGSNELIIDMKIKATISIGFGRKNSRGHMASLMFCDDQVRINHHQTIDKNGVVSYSLRSKPQMDKKHDAELKIDNSHRVIFLHWIGIMFGAPILQ